MDREILFRGKRLDKFRPGEWIYGYYVPCCFGSFPCRPAIVPEPDGQWEPFEVDPSTVGQYTGKTVKTGKVFQDDICKSIDGVFLVVWDDEKAAFMMQFYDGYNERLYLEDMWEDSEVIGSVHDNPELMGGKQ